MKLFTDPYAKQRRYRQRLLARRQCSRCPKKSRKGHTMCDSCRKKKAAAMRQQRSATKRSATPDED